MPSYTIKLKDLPKKIREAHQDRMALIVKTIQQTCQERGPYHLMEAVANTTPYVPVDRGTYRRSWQVDLTPDGATIYNSTKYASIIERGRRAGAKMPPVKLIAEWVRRKGLIKMPATKSKSKKKAQAAAIMGAAFVIARSIAKKGTPGKWVFKRALTKIVPEVIKAVHDALKAY